MMTSNPPSLGAIKDTKLTIERDLTAVEYEIYKEARDRILRFWSDYELLVIVVMNYLDFEDYMKSATSLASAGRERDIRAEVNRRILNLLSSFRSFLDHSETKLNRRYGEHSIQFQHFKKETNRVYDSFFSYRFLYELRNYIQHCGMPLGLLKHSASIIDLETKETQVTLTISFDRDSLLSEWDKWKLPLRNEINQQPAQLPIDPLLRELMWCIQQINNVVIEDELPALEQAALVIQALITPIMSNGQPVLVRIEEKDDVDRFTTKDGYTYPTSNIQLEYIPIFRIDPDSKEIFLTV